MLRHMVPTPFEICIMQSTGLGSDILSRWFWKIAALLQELPNGIHLFAVDIDGLGHSRGLLEAFLLPVQTPAHSPGKNARELHAQAIEQEGIFLALRLLILWIINKLYTEGY